MGERRTTVTARQVWYTCDECNGGVLELTGTALLSDPPQFPHKCTYCGKETVLPKAYPFIEFVDDDTRPE